MYTHYTNDFSIIGTCMTIYEHFNDSMELFYKLMKGVHTLTFEEDPMRVIMSKFNKRVILTKNIKVVVFGAGFNNHLILNKNVVDIDFGVCFNQPFNFTKCIKRLKFRNFFNKLVQLSKNIYSIEFGVQFDNHLILPKKLKCLSLGSNFNKTFVQTKYLKNILFFNVFNCKQQIASKNYHLMDRTYDMKIVCVGTNHNLFDNLSNSAIIEIYAYFALDVRLDNVPNDKNKIFVLMK